VHFDGGGAERRGGDAHGIVEVGRFGILAADVVDLVVVFWVAKVDFVWGDSDDGPYRQDQILG
jgi:hypothetical protein